LDLADGSRMILVVFVNNCVPGTCTITACDKRSQVGRSASQHRKRNEKKRG
jgi:hypothetical protein